MTATEELRRLLDERGVKWWPLGSDMTECVVDGVRIKYRQVGRGLIVSTCTEGTVTPEQAIAATLGDAAKFYTTEYDPRNIVGAGKLNVTLDLTNYAEVRIVAGEHFVATTPDRFVECMAWLLTNVDTDTLVTKDGIEVDG